MTKSLLVVLLAVAICLFAPRVASAHVLKIDGDIGAELHINPDDNPVVGVSINYTLSFQNKGGLFNLSDCDCNVAMINNGKLVAVQKLKDSGGGVSSNYYTFPDAGTYTFRVTGVPRHSNEFQDFTLNYVVRVEGGNTGEQSIPPLLWLGLGTGIGLVLLYTYSLGSAKESEK